MSGNCISYIDNTDIDSKLCYKSMEFFYKMRFVAVLLLHISISWVDGAPCQSEPKCTRKALQMWGELRDELDPSR